MKIITVPKDGEAMVALDYNEASDDQLIEMRLDDREFYAVWESGFFDSLNDMAKVNINDYEDDAITNVEVLKEVVSSGLFERELGDAELNGLLKQMKELFQEAIVRGTGVFFFF